MIPVQVSSVIKGHALVWSVSALVAATLLGFGWKHWSRTPAKSDARLAKSARERGDLREHEEQSQAPRREIPDIPEVELGAMPPDSKGAKPIVPTGAPTRVGFAAFEQELGPPGDLKKPALPTLDVPMVDGPPRSDPGAARPPAALPSQSGHASVPSHVPPRPIEGFGPRQARFPLLGDPAIATQGVLPTPTAADLAAYGKYVHGLVDPANTFDVIQGRTRLLVLKAVPRRIHVANEGIIGWATSGRNDVTVAGQQVGTTVLNLWFSAVDDPTREAVVSYVVRVAPDPEAKFRLERAFKALEAEINQAVPGSRVQLKLVGDAILVSGQTADALDAERVVRIVTANVPTEAAKRPGSVAHPKVVNMIRTERPDGQSAQQQLAVACKALEPQLGAAFPDSRVQLRLVGDAIVIFGDAPHRREAAQIVNVLAGSKPGAKFVDRLRVVGAEQVMLKVVVAEVNRTAANRQGPKLNLPRQSACVDRGQNLYVLQALRRASCAKSLAEPNLVTIDGQTAKFDVGGQLIAPGTGPTPTAPTVIPYGVHLEFTPAIIERDRIRLQVAASVSAKDSATPGKLVDLNARGFSSTVELSEGETLAVAGLIHSHGDANRSTLPMLKTGPDEQELVILITPEFVRQTPPAVAPPVRPPATEHGL